MSALKYDYETIPIGYYDKIFCKQKGVQSCWHYLKFFGVKKRIPPETQTLLDVGCGPGTFLGNFMDDSIQAVGFDISSSQISYATNKYGKENLTFIAGEGDLPFSSASFDVITCIELIEHLDNQEIEKLLKECHRVLKPGGKFIITTPNYKSLWIFLEKLLNKLSPVSYEHQHITHFNKKSLKRILEKNNFSVEVKSYLGFAPFLSVISWGLAKCAAKYEKWIENNYGFLLIGSCVKK